MNPFYFGRADRRLFGIYDPPAGPPAARGVVLCHPLAREYLLAYPTMRQLARRLAAAGMPVLRFDYHGTGDSGGEFEREGWGAWVADVGTAVDELRDVAQVREVALVGLRLGAALAAAAAGAAAATRLVLWDPVCNGPALLAEYGIADITAPTVEAQGAVFTRRLRAELASLACWVEPSWTASTLVVHSGPPHPGANDLTRALEAAGVPNLQRSVPDTPVWAEEWSPGGVRMAVDVVEEVVTWLGA